MRTFALLIKAILYHLSLELQSYFKGKEIEKATADPKIMELLKDTL